MSAPAIFRQSIGLFYSKLDTTGAGLVPVAKLRTVLDPNAGNTAGAGVNLIFEDPRDPHASLAYRDQLFSNGVRVGLFTAPSWYAAAFPSTWKNEWGQPLPDPLLYRQQVSKDVLRLLRIGDPVVLDFEKIPVDYQLAFLIGVTNSTLQGWRGKGGLWGGGSNPWRETAFSNMPHQANPTGMYARAGGAYLAQLYDDRMKNVPSWQEAQWETSTGQNLADSFPIYDASDFATTDLVPGSYLFDQNLLARLFQP